MFLHAEHSGTLRDVGPRRAGGRAPRHPVAWHRARWPVTTLSAHRRTPNTLGTWHQSYASTSWLWNPAVNSCRRTRRDPDPGAGRQRAAPAPGTVSAGVRHGGRLGAAGRHGERPRAARPPRRARRGGTGATRSTRALRAPRTPDGRHPTGRVGPGAARAGRERPTGGAARGRTARGRRRPMTARGARRRAPAAPPAGHPPSDAVRSERIKRAAAGTACGRRDNGGSDARSRQ